MIANVILRNLVIHFGVRFFYLQANKYLWVVQLNITFVICPSATQEREGVQSMGLCITIGQTGAQCYGGQEDSFQSN